MLDYIVKPLSKSVENGITVISGGSHEYFDKVLTSESVVDVNSHASYTCSPFLFGKRVFNLNVSSDEFIGSIIAKFNDTEKDDKQAFKHMLAIEGDAEKDTIIISKTLDSLFKTFPSNASNRSHTYMVNINILSLYVQYAFKHNTLMVMTPGNAERPLLNGFFSNMKDGLHTCFTKYVSIPAKLLHDKFPKEVATCKSYGVIRNPFKRALASFEYINSYTKFYNVSFGSVEEMCVFAESEDSVWNKPERITPQCDWVLDDTGKILVDELIPFDNLQKKWLRICKDCKWPIEPLVGENVTELTDEYTQSKLTQADIDCIKRVYAKDIELYEQITGEKLYA